ncbi:hypothetical protein H2204_009546 [Knufia peltigerae]|uniref:Uncharacterized protein n=1 Tax=Knufia peltigerae TaxID=1002370 RepID=A0AA39CVV3_9EURO|nr:hypothetical protein H2204_009546 [Knufia peltigerae]
METRGSKRKSSAISPPKPTGAPSYQTTTPLKKGPHKKLRFSDSVLLEGSTGLTPAVGKASLKTPKLRRASTPAVTRYQDHDEVQFQPYTDCLTPRTVRQVRRHGLSETMNQYYADQKTNKKLEHQLELRNNEIQKLKAELAEAQHRNDPAEELCSSQTRINEMQAEIEQLQQSFSNAGDDDDAFPIFEDETAADDNPQSDALDPLMESDLENARRDKQSLFTSTRSISTNTIAFEDSPVRPRIHPNLPSPPRDDQILSKELAAATNRAEDAELALKALDLEIKSLGFSPRAYDDDPSDCVATIKQHFLDMRLELERIVPGETVASFENALLIPEALAKLKKLADRVREREAELKSMRDERRCLKGNFDHAIVRAQEASSRIKELEETVDKNAEEMLDIRMRSQALEREAREHEANNQRLIVQIESYRLEVKKMEELFEKTEAEHAATLQEIHAATTQEISDMDAKVSAETRGRRAAEESAVERLRKINDLESALASARQQADVAKQHLSRLEQELESSRSAHTNSTKTHAEEIGGLNSRISNLSTALASADAEIEKLKHLNVKLEDRYNAEIQHASRVVDHMSVEFTRAVAKVAEQRKGYIRGATVRHANWQIESDDLVSDPILPMTPASVVRFSSPEYEPLYNDDDDHVPGSVEIGRGKGKKTGGAGSRRGIVPGLGIMKKKPRRRYDSGIGMGSLSEAEDETVSSDPMTPELSSEFDVETEAYNRMMVTG